MRILDLYIGRFTYHSAATTFISKAFVSISSIIKSYEQVKGN